MFSCLDHLSIGDYKTRSDDLFVATDANQALKCTKLVREVKVLCRFRFWIAPPNGPYNLDTTRATPKYPIAVYGQSNA